MAIDQSFSPPDLLPGNEDEKGKERARPWEHARVYGGAKAFCFWASLWSEEGEILGFLTYNWLGVRAG